MSCVPAWKHPCSLFWVWGNSFYHCIRLWRVWRLFVQCFSSGQEVRPSLTLSPLTQKAYWGGFMCCRQALKKGATEEVSPYQMESGIYNCLDDWLILVQPEDLMCQHRDSALNHLWGLSLRMNPRKNVLLFLSWTVVHIPGAAHLATNILSRHGLRPLELRLFAKIVILIWKQFGRVEVYLLLANSSVFS